VNNVKLGDRVRVQCTRIRTNTNGDGARPRIKVFEFTAGSGGVMRGLSTGVIGMAPGEHRRLTLQPAEAYGHVQPKLVKELPRAQFPRRIKLRVGKRLIALSKSSGRQRRVRVVEINPKSIKVDGNHALAGQVIELEVLLISVDRSSDANRSDLGGES
jgi:FKBP-type peptidyl-prolyl cis-trans isomerase 2